MQIMLYCPMNSVRIKHNLKRIEGQVRGIMAMLDKDTYCIDILTQCRAVRASVQNVERIILHNHLASCVKTSFLSSDPSEQEAKIEEIVSLFASKWSD